MEGACCHPGAWFLGQPDEARQGRGELRGSQPVAQQLCHLIRIRGLSLPGTLSKRGFAG